MAIIIYARKSVERENSISCETQIEYCRTMIKPDERSEEVIPIVDNGFSGGNVNRDGFQKMMKLISLGKIRKVIVYKIDRISRSLSDFMNILEDFKKHHVEFVSSQESFDTTSPYGEMIIKLLMVFAEFERTSAIERVTQAYAHRSDMGFYMGGRCPYGFELVPAVIRNVRTKKLEPIPAEIEQIRCIFERYSLENISLRRLRDWLIAENHLRFKGKPWTTSSLSTILKNPIYVKADSDIYAYYEKQGVRIISDLSAFTGEYGAQLYNHTKSNRKSADHSGEKLVLLSHCGIIDSSVWLKCQHKLQKNRQITNSYSNPTSWLAGKVICETCGHTMTTVKSRVNKSGEVRRYFSCTGKSHKKICTGPNVTIYAADMEAMVYECIAVKFSDLKNTIFSAQPVDSAESNDIRLKLLSIEKSRQQLVDLLLSADINKEMKELLNQRACRLTQEQNALNEQLDILKRKANETVTEMDLEETWKTADYDCRKSIAMRMIHQITVSGDGNLNIVWTI